MFKWKFAKVHLWMPLAAISALILLPPLTPAAIASPVSQMEQASLGESNAGTGQITVDDLVPAVPPPGVAGGASEAELIEQLEEGCNEIKVDAPVCDKLSGGDVRKIPGDIKNDEQELHDLAVKLVTPSQQASRSSLGFADLTKNIKTIAQASKNPAVRSLTDKASDFADWTSRAVVKGSAVTENTAYAYSKAAISIILSFAPPLGDLFSLADGAITGNTEQMVCAVIGLAATAIGLAFPPAGAVIAVGLAIYSLGSFIWSFFCAKSRNWVTEPPATPRELFDRGADIRWEDVMVAGEAANLVLSKDKKSATQTLLLDSRWSRPSNENPVKYTVETRTTGSYTFVLEPASDNRADAPPKYIRPSYSMSIFQDGKQYNLTCAPFPLPDGRGIPFHCGLPKKDVITISAGRSAVMKGAFTYDNSTSWLDSRICAPAPCLASKKGYSNLFVYSEGSTKIGLSLPFVVARSS